MESSAASDARPPWRRAYPYRGSRIDLSSLTYHYIDSRDESSDVSESHPGTLLCVHGNPTWSFYWRGVIDRFGARYRVVVPDHIGCGLSDKPPRSQFDYTLTAHRDHLIGLIDRLDLRHIVLVAHDWGGAIGLAAALERLDRLAGVILLNTAAFPPPYVPLRIAACRVPLIGTLAIRGFNLFARAAVSMAMSRRAMRPEVAAGLLAPYGSWADRVAIDAFVRDIPLSTGHRSHAVLERLEADLPRFGSLPRLLVWGMRDWCFRPQCLARFLQHWPDADVVRIDDAGHYVLEDAPQETLEAIDGFLQRRLDWFGDG